ncbi:DarT ssDNA thymidine ADP-ribosyltransferase family protein [Paenibacillaceae bacterium WGS1546]|uniref:DarT ssDNA thymidine ADP-ribosyltransferase family protein n=1 Tax=Cohnella sp. WGS1546 TaxID=3366810 RepID=UPI00372D0F9A
MSQKSDANIFEQVIEDLKTQPWLNTSRKWWPDYLFHFTDICNAAEILKSGCLLSRKRVGEKGSMASENASTAVIEQTDEKWKDYVRFYFRPKTPTQYNNEGFRPKDQINYLGAHCPVPVFFLFKSKPLLTRKDSVFSLGSLAVNGAEAFNSGEMFQKMPFQDIYHVGPYDKLLNFNIKYNRHAEVAIPEMCSLEHLHRIVCRSNAERNTLCNLLPSDCIQWLDKIIVDTRLNLFHHEWAYIERVEFDKKKINLYFHKGSKVNGTFKALLRIIEHHTGIHYSWSNDSYMITGIETFALTNIKYPDHYTVEFYLDHQLAFRGTYMDKDELLPF